MAMVVRLGFLFLSKYMLIKTIKIKTSKGYRLIGPGQPVFIVAEMSGNHNMDINRAYKIIDEAVMAGVDAVKLQTYTADTITIKSDKKWFQITKGPWAGQTLYDLYKTTYTPWQWQPRLKKYAEDKGIIFFSTPFDETSVDFLEKMKVKLYKIASYEMTDMLLLEKIGRTGKPVFISRAMASVKEINTAIKILKKAGTSQVAVLQCVNSYPAAPDQMNLATISDIAKRFGTIVGLSDHSLGIIVPLTSVALGASIIEKHLTLCRGEGGADASFSLEPQEMKQLVVAVREAEKAIGKPTYQISKNEAENFPNRRSLFIVKNIKKGEKLSKGNIRSIRPGHGLATKYFKKVLGKEAVHDLEAGTPLAFNLIM